MIEIWKPVEGYEGLYEVSNFGRVKGLIRGNMLTPNAHCKTGYLRVNLCNGVGKTYYVHQLVARAFVLNPNGFCEVNHKDENKSNNSADNLEWCDRYYNTHYGERNRKIGEANKKRRRIFQSDIEKMKSLRDNNVRVEKIAHMFGVSKKYVYKLTAPTKWGEVS